MGITNRRHFYEKKYDVWRLVRLSTEWFYLWRTLRHLVTNAQTTTFYSLNFNCFQTEYDWILLVENCGM